MSNSLKIFIYTAHEMVCYVNLTGHNGLAQSNARVSSFMRNLDSSVWLTEASLKVIKESNVSDSTVVNSFTLTFKQIFPKDGEEEES